MRTAIVPFVLAALGAAAPAQFGTFVVRGKVEKLAKPPACSPRATHRVICTEIYLKAAKGFDLAKWEGKNAELVGGLAFALCPTLEIRDAKAPRYDFRFRPFFFGSYRLGERFTIRQTAPFLSVVPLLLASKPGFLPLGTIGTLELDPLGTVWVRNDIALLGFTLHILQIPKDKALIGVRILGQGAYLSALPNRTPEFALLNVDCFTIRG